MSIEQIAYQQIRFKRQWSWQPNKEGMPLDLRDIARKNVKQLPGSSQWHRLQNRVRAADDVNAIEAILKDCGDRLPVWQFKVKDRRFIDLLKQAFVNPVKNHEAVEELRGATYFGLQWPPEMSLPAPETFKRLVVQKALLSFIDEVLLIREGLKWNETESSEHSGYKEVRYYAAS